ncbi:MAG: hypothetical protein J0L57_16545 [Burkholderiales bacterium]|nr:hypothetical protein [Burkholderiales bacterium]
MNRHPPFVPVRLASVLGLFAVAATTVTAAPPQIAYMEKAQVQASGTQIRSFGVPTTDSTGKVLYWDVTVDLAIDADGRPNAAATVAAVKKVTVKSNLLVAGKYLDSYGGTCTVANGTLTGGRVESSISCVNRSYRADMHVVNGSITGHPYKVELQAAGVAAFQSFGDSGWGLVGYEYGYACAELTHVVSARQVGTQIVITNYGSDTVVNCTLTLAPAP